MSGSGNDDPPRPRPPRTSAPPPLPGSARTTPPPSSGSFATCLLRVGDRLALRAYTPPEAEYLLFDPADVELRTSESGRVREHGYEATAASALERLDILGIDADLGREFAERMQPVLAEAYARGTSVRRVARHLGALELLQAESYDGRIYKGAFLDLAGLARDLGEPNAATTLQALYLATLLVLEPPNTRVFLATHAWTKQKKPGERTFRRPNLADPLRLLGALEHLALAGPRPEVKDHLARQDVIAFLRTRADAAPDEPSRLVYAELEEQLAMRELPERGPLADAELWAMETRLDLGQLDGIMDHIEALEHARGRTPGTTYLRARASLALRLEEPRAVAERISSLALSMTSFQELTLLAAEAWLEAGDSRRAMPFARDLVEAPNLEEGLLLRAQRLLARAVGAAPAGHRLGTPPPLLPDDSIPTPTKTSKIPTMPQGFSVPAPPLTSSVPPPERALTLEPPSMPLLGEIELGSQPELPAEEPNRPPSPPPSLPAQESGASFTLDVPPTPRAPPTSSLPPRRRVSGVMLETRPPRSNDPRAEPEEDEPIASSPRMNRQPSARDRTSKPPADRRVMVGADLPPFAVESPAPRLSKVPLLPRSTRVDELAEHLTLPPGVAATARAPDVLPASVLEARVHFTILSRELGLDYRLQHGIQLRVDRQSLEKMQETLLASYPDGQLASRDDSDDLRRHGAFLSELLARRFEAEWFDMSAPDLGHWAMIVPPDTRVWPFARIARLVATGKRDLGDFFREIHARFRR